TEATCGFFRASFLKEIILLRTSLVVAAERFITWSLLKPRSLLRRYFNWPYTTHVQMSMIMEIENCTTTNARRSVALLELFDKLPLKIFTGLNFKRKKAE